jgi:hypothetical protein
MTDDPEQTGEINAKAPGAVTVMPLKAGMTSPGALTVITSPSSKKRV